MPANPNTPPPPGRNEVPLEQLRVLHDEVTRRVAKAISDVPIPMNYQQTRNPDTGEIYDGHLPPNTFRFGMPELRMYLCFTGGEANRLQEAEVIYKQMYEQTDKRLTKIKKSLTKYSTGPNADVRQANVELDRLVIEVEEAEEFFRQVFERIKVARVNTERDHAMVSRLITAEEKMIGGDTRYNNTPQNQPGMGSNPSYQPYPHRR